MLISVIVPFYKGNKYINNILRMIDRNSKVCSDIAEIELIIVNDSPGYLISYDKNIFKSGRLKIYENSKNLGIHKSRISGINHSSGDYILMLDQDDVIEDNTIYDQLNKIGNSDMIISNGYIHNVSGKKEIYINKYSHKLSKNYNYYLYYANQIVSPGQCLIKRSAIPNKWLECKLEYNGSDDLFLWILMLYNKATVELNEEYLYHHIYTGINLSSDINKMIKSSEYVYDILKDNNLIDKKSIKIFNRRLNFRSTFNNSDLIRKFILCLKNIDICYYGITEKLIKFIN